MMYDDVHSSQQSPCASPLQPGSPTQRCSKGSWPVVDHPKIQGETQNTALPIPSNEKACLHCKHKDGNYTLAHSSHVNSETGNIARWKLQT